MYEWFLGSSANVAEWNFENWFASYNSESSLKGASDSLLIDNRVRCSHLLRAKCVGSLNLGLVSFPNHNVAVFLYF